MSEPRHPTDSRVWVWWEGRESRVGFTKPLPRHNAVEYMRVLSRQEVEKLASDEGVDVQQLINTYLRTIEGQRRHIGQLREVLNRMVTAHDEILSETESTYPPPDAGCIECTAGTVPNRLNTGLCAYHQAKGLLRG